MLDWEHSLSSLKILVAVFRESQDIVEFDFIKYIAQKSGIFEEAEVGPTILPLKHVCTVERKTYAPISNIKYRFNKSSTNQT